MPARLQAVIDGCDYMTGEILMGGGPTPHLVSLMTSVTRCLVGREAGVDCYLCSITFVPLIQTPTECSR